MPCVNMGHTAYRCGETGFQDIPEAQKVGVSLSPCGWVKLFPGDLTRRVPALSQRN